MKKRIIIDYCYDHKIRYRFGQKPINEHLFCDTELRRMLYSIGKIIDNFGLGKK